MCLFLRRWWRQWRRQRWWRRDEDDDYNDDDIFFRFIPSVDVVLLIAAVLCTLRAKCTLELSGFQRENQEFFTYFSNSPKKISNNATKYWSVCCWRNAFLYGSSRFDTKWERNVNTSKKNIGCIFLTNLWLIYPKL